MLYQNAILTCCIAVAYDLKGGTETDYMASLHSHGFFSSVWYERSHKNCNQASGLFFFSTGSSLLSEIMIAMIKSTSHQFPWSSVPTQVTGHRKGGTYRIIPSIYQPRTTSTFFIHNRDIFQLFLETPVMEIPQNSQSEPCTCYFQRRIYLSVCLF